MLVSSFAFVKKFADTPIFAPNVNLFFTKLYVTDMGIPIYRNECVEVNAYKLSPITGLELNEGNMYP